MPAGATARRLRNRWQAAIEECLIDVTHQLSPPMLGRTLREVFTLENNGVWKRRPQREVGATLHEGGPICGLGPTLIDLAGSRSYDFCKRMPYRPSGCINRVLQQTRVVFIQQCSLGLVVGVPLIDKSANKLVSRARSGRRLRVVEDAFHRVALCSLASSASPRRASRWHAAMTSVISQVSTRIYARLPFAIPRPTPPLCLLSHADMTTA